MGILFQLEVILNSSLMMTINYFVGEAECLLPSGDLRKATNHCLAEVVSLLLSGGLRKTTNQFGGFGQPQIKSCSISTLACYCLIDRTSKLKT